MRLLLAFSMLGWAVPALAGPLGLKMGMSLEQLRSLGAVEGDGSPGWYRATNVPEPPWLQGAFHHYEFLVTQSRGLCKVLAVGTPFKSGPDGKALRTITMGLVADLSKIYGRCILIDEPRRPGRPEDPSAWMQELAEDQRVLSCTWDLKITGSKLPAGVESVQVKASAVAGGIGGFFLSFESERFAECLEETGRSTSHLYKVTRVKPLDPVTGETTIKVEKPRNGPREPDAGGSSKQAPPPSEGRPTP